MPAIKSIAAIREKWKRVTPGRTRDFTLGVENPRRDWARAAIESAEAYIRGLQEALAEGRWERGIEKAGSDKWKKRTLEKGPTRWSQGVGLADEDYADGFKPYRDLIASIDLPPRGPKGDPANLERVRIIAEALHALKVEIG